VSSPPGFFFLTPRLNPFLGVRLEQISKPTHQNIRVRAQSGIVRVVPQQVCELDHILRRNICA
jgi:hypothetical protein